VPIGPETFQYIAFIVNIIMFAVFFMISFIKHRPNKYLVSVILLILLSIVYGIRSVRVGIDSLQYATIFTKASLARDDLEPMFILISKILGLVVSEPQYYFITINLLTNYFVLISFKKLDRDNYPALFSLFLTSFLFVNMNVSMIRQGLAMAFAFYAVSSYITDKNLKISILFSLLSLATHLSAIVFLFSFVLSRIKFEKIILYAYCILTVSLFSFNTASIIAPFQGIHWLIGKLY